LAVVLTEFELSEDKKVFLKRYTEACEYGLTKREAYLFATSSTDVGELRRLVRSGCPPIVGAQILL
jgi:hypothetical protein